MNENLIDELKSRLDITWKNDITDTRLTNIIKNSIPKINRIIGITLSDADYMNKDYTEELELLLNYCMYAWENKTEFFKQNYFDDIMSLQQKHEVENYRSEINKEGTENG